jgi:hypothetical protein
LSKEGSRLELCISLKVSVYSREGSHSERFTILKDVIPSLKCFEWTEPKIIFVVPTCVTRRVDNRRFERQTVVP